MGKLIRIFVPFIFFILFFLFVFQSDVVMQSAGNGIEIWAKSALPVLLPSIILVQYATRYHMMDLFFSISKRMKGKKNPLILPLFLIGISCGYPIGALYICHYYKKGLLTKRLAEKLLPVCSFFTPIFLNGYVRPLFHLSDKGWAISLFCLYAPLVLWLIQIIIFDKKKIFLPFEKDYKNADSQYSSSSQSSQNLLLDSLDIIFTIGIYMMLFSILFGLTYHFQIPDIPVFHFLLCSLEATSGLYQLSCLHFSNPFLSYFFSMMILSFGGVCSMAQVYGVIGDSDLSIKKYAVTKGIFTFMTAVLVLLSCYF